MMKNNTWQLQEAKSKFSQLVDRAMHDKPQIVTRHGNNSVVVLSYEQYKRITMHDTALVEFLRNSPLMGLELDSIRNKDLPREIKI